MSYEMNYYKKKKILNGSVFLNNLTPMYMYVRNAPTL